MNAEWDRGNARGWTVPDGYDAWLTNMWNGSVPGGSGEMSHSKVKWSGSCKEDKIASPNAYCIWGQFEVTHEHVRGADGGHEFLAHATAACFGKQIDPAESHRLTTSTSREGRALRIPGRRGGRWRRVGDVPRRASHQ